MADKPARQNHSVVDLTIDSDEELETSSEQLLQQFKSGSKPPSSSSPRPGLSFGQPEQQVRRYPTAKLPNTNNTSTPSHRTLAPAITSRPAPNPGQPLFEAREWPRPNPSNNANVHTRRTASSMSMGNSGPSPVPSAPPTPNGAAASSAVRSPSQHDAPISSASSPRSHTAPRYQFEHPPVKKNMLRPTLSTRGARSSTGTRSDVKHKNTLRHSPTPHSNISQRLPSGNQATAGSPSGLNSIPPIQQHGRKQSFPSSVGSGPSLCSVISKNSTSDNRDYVQTDAWRDTRMVERTTQLAGHKRQINGTLIDDTRIGHGIRDPSRGSEAAVTSQNATMSASSQVPVRQAPLQLNPVQPASFQPLPSQSVPLQLSQFQQPASQQPFSQSVPPQNAASSAIQTPGSSSSTIFTQPGRDRFPEFSDYPYEVNSLSKRKKPRSQTARIKENSQTQRLIAEMGHIPNTITGPPTQTEQNLLCHLKEDLALGWDDIWSYFPHSSSWHRLQTFYSKQLNRREGRHISASTPIPAQASNNTRRESTSSRSQLSETSSISNPLAMPTEQRRSRRIVATGRNQVGALSEHKIWEEHLRDQDTLMQEPDSEMSSGPEPTNRPVVRAHHNHSFRKRLFWDTDNRSVVNVDNPFLGTQAQQDTELRRRQIDRAAFSGMLSMLRRSPAVLPSRYLSPKAIKRKRRSVTFLKPYLNELERETLKAAFSDEEHIASDISRVWSGAALHVDFNLQELDALRECLSQTIKSPIEKDSFRNIAKVISDETIQKTIHNMIHYGPLLGRTPASLKSFFDDLRYPESSDSCARFSAKKIQRIVLRPEAQDPAAATLLRRRELALGKGINTSLKRALRFGPYMSFKGMSGDVMESAWARNGTQFAVGATALTDSSSMQYNEQNNLLLGSMVDRTLLELPFHCRARKAQSGINASYSMMASQDPLLFMPITSVRFALEDRALLTTGGDGYARVFDLTGPKPEIKWGMPSSDGKSIDLLDVNSNETLFATGIRSPENPIRVYKLLLDCDDDFDPNELKIMKLAAPESNTSSEMVSNYVPSTLRWAPKGWNQYLASGFDDSEKSFGSGQFCIWDIGSGVEKPICQLPTRSVFDMRWSETVYGRIFVGSTVVNHSVNKGIKSVVRIYDSFRASTIRVNQQRTIELECPALDMNDIILNPVQDNLVAAGCTDGVTYVWDLRKPDDILHRLCHGPSLTPSNDEEPAEKTDTGVRFVSWDSGYRTLFTGSSDGIVASWDPLRAPEDAYLETVASLESGVMTGALNHDNTDLLIGEVSGKFSILSLGRDQDDELEDFAFIEAEDEKAELREKHARSSPAMSTSNTPGSDAARHLVASGQIDIKPFGSLPFRQAVQGPAYKGPYRDNSDAQALRAAASEFQAKHRPVGGEELCSLDHTMLLRTEEDEIDNLAWKQKIPWDLVHSHPDPVSSLRCTWCTDQPLEPVRADSVYCSACGRTLKPGCLGYELEENVFQYPLGARPAWAICKFGDQSLSEAEVLQDHQGWLLSKWGCESGTASGLT